MLVSAIISLILLSLLDDSIKTIKCESTTETIECCGKEPNNKAESYGAHISFPTFNASISTNYPWLPHNSDPYHNPIIPKKYRNMPIQPLGNRQKFYDDIMTSCRNYFYKKDPHACDEYEEARFEQNLLQPKSTINYTKIGYEKHDVLPSHMWKKLKRFWDINKNIDPLESEEWPIGNTYVNWWESPIHMLDTDDERLKGSGYAFEKYIEDTLQPLVTKWVGGIDIIPVAFYGIRIYTEDAFLTTHVDRTGNVFGVFINIDQDVDEDWPLEVLGHDGILVNITMKPGEMIFVETHSILHGRPFSLKGRFYANLFIHFEPKVPRGTPKGALPPYLLKGSPWADIWFSEYQFSLEPAQV